MDNGELSDYWDCWPGQLERFARLAFAAGAQAEREACAKVCEDDVRTWSHPGSITRAECAVAIRARGEKK